MNIGIDRLGSSRRNRKVPPDVIMPTEEELSQLEAGKSDGDRRNWLPKIASLLAVAAPIFQTGGILKFYFSLGAAAVHGDLEGVFFGLLLFAAGGLAALVGALLAAFSMYKTGRAKVVTLIACIEFLFFAAVSALYLAYGV